jgi:hypothetical protein
VVGVGKPVGVLPIVAAGSIDRAGSVVGTGIPASAVCVGGTRPQPEIISTKISNRQMHEEA